MGLFGICSQAVVLEHAVKTNQQRTTHLCPFSHKLVGQKKKKKSLCEEEVLDELLKYDSMRFVEPCTSTMLIG